jgi:DNA-binding response OmpR family regulator
MYNATMPQTILIVERDRDLSRSIDHILTEEGYVVTTTDEHGKAVTLAKKIKPDLIVLDDNLPNMSTQDLCKDVKDLDPQTHVVMLARQADEWAANAETAKNELSACADDYIPKPFVMDDLLAHVKAILASSLEIPDEIRVANLVIKPKTFEVKRRGKAIHLTQTEFQLLLYLARNKDQVLTREMILNHVWSYTPDIESRVVDVYIGYLRKKLTSGDAHTLIHSVRGYGYVLRDATEE